MPCSFWNSNPPRRLPAISIRQAMVCALWVANGGVEEVAAVEQALGAGEIGDVGRDLAGEDGIVGEPQLLRPLHLAVPVRTLDQADHDLPRGAAGEIGEPVDHVHRTLLVGLHREAQPVPAGQALVAGQGLEEVERGLQPLALLGVDRELDVPLAGDLRQLDDPRQQLGLEPPPAAVLVARVQGRELDRQAGTVVQRRAGGTGRDPLQASPGRSGSSAGRRVPSSPPRPACRRSSGSPAPGSFARARSPARSSARARTAGPGCAWPGASPRGPRARPGARQGGAARLGICSPGWSQPITVPESMRPKAEALIRKLSERATRLCQSTSSILSRIRRSWVRASGMRSSASARHMSMTPSCVLRL